MRRCSVRLTSRPPGFHLSLLSHLWFLPLRLVVFHRKPRIPIPSLNRPEFPLDATSISPSLPVAQAAPPSACTLFSIGVPGAAHRNNHLASVIVPVWLRFTVHGPRPKYRIGPPSHESHQHGQICLHLPFPTPPLLLLPRLFPREVPLAETQLPEIVVPHAQPFTSHSLNRKRNAGSLHPGPSYSASCPSPCGGRDPRVQHTHPAKAAECQASADSPEGLAADKPCVTSRARRTLVDLGRHASSFDSRTRPQLTRRLRTSSTTSLQA